MARRRKTEPFGDFIQKTLRALLPPERLTVSQWAEKHRVLDTRTSALPGKWSNDITPYLVDIMDELNNPDIETIVFVKPTQVGGTEVLLNVMGYIIGQDPSPAMMVMPTKDTAEGVSAGRIQPMILSSDQLKQRFRERESSRLHLILDGMHVLMRGANSAQGLASWPVRILLLDEVDKYPSTTGKEADPISLAKERTKTFSNRKIFIASTPTLASGNVWQAKESAEAEKHYFVPCPHCGQKIELAFDQIKWPSGEDMTPAARAELAHYACQECGALITDGQKPMMLRQGTWEYVRKNKERPTSVCYWLNTLYSPFVTWAEIAKMFLISKSDPEQLQNFRNSWLAEPWQDQLTVTDADMVLSQKSGYPAFVAPDGAKVLMGGIDIQRDCVYWEVRAFGSKLTSWLVAYGQAKDLDDAVKYMDMEYHKPSGETMMVEVCGVDSGDQTNDAYDFCLQHQEWALACKGSSHPMTGHYRMSSVNKENHAARGMRLLIVDSGKYKDMIAAHMRIQGAGAWMVHDDCELDYAEQVTAEHKVNIKRGGKLVSVWQPKRSHIDNHYLDTDVLCHAVADAWGIRRLIYEEEQDVE